LSKSLIGIQFNKGDKGDNIEPNENRLPFATKRPFTVTSWEPCTHQTPITEVVPDLNILIEIYYLLEEILTAAEGTRLTIKTVSGNP